MNIEFELVNKEFVNIIGVEGEVRKKIGHIFTPSGSGNNVKNAIQICGFEEAFDLWGCGLFGEHSGAKEPLTENDIIHLKEFATSENKWQREHAEKTLKNGYRDSIWAIMKKDIQLAFKMYDNKQEIGVSCWRCYSTPCHCENDRPHLEKGIMPYNVKRESAIKDKLEYVDENKEKINEELNKEYD